MKKLSPQTNRDIFRTDEYFKTIFDQTSVAMSISELNGEWTFMNQAYPKMFGYDMSELQKMTYLDITHPNDRKDDILDRKKLLNGTIPVLIKEKRYIHKNGSIVWGIVHVSVIKDPSGKPQYTTAVIQNITKRKLTEKALRQSEDRYKSFITQSSEGIWRLEVEKPFSINDPIDTQIKNFYKYGYLAECNDVMAKMYGYKKASDIVGARLSDLLIPDDPNNITYLKKFIQSGYKLTNAESYELDKNGNLHIFQNNLIGIIEDGYGKRAWGTQRDITQQKINEERQKFLEKISTKLVSSFNQNITLQEIGQLIVPFLADYCRIVTIDKNEKIHEVNVNHSDPTKVQLAENLYENYKNRPETTHGIGNILKTGKSEIIAKIDKNILSSVKNNPKLLSIIKKIGLKSYIGVPLFARGKIIGAMTFSSVKKNRFYDNNDLKFIEEIARRIALTLDNNRLYQQSQEAITLRDDFISMASHELKTPVTSIKIFTQLLQKKLAIYGDTQDINYIQKMDKQLNKLTDLIYNMLNISKIQTGHIEFTKKIFDFDRSIHEIVEILQASSPKHTIIIKGETNKKIYADEDRIEQVVCNLISNAIKYSPLAKKVIIHLQANSKNIQFGVQDFGIGIAKEHFEKIFERFYRVSDNTNKTFPGLGIGLYISYQIITRHKGKFWVESTEKKGSTFYFSLPLKRYE